MNNKQLVENYRPISLLTSLEKISRKNFRGPLLFLVCINDLPNELKSSAKLFTDDTSIFTIAKDKNENANILNNDLLLMSKLAYNWKMVFNPDHSKPAPEKGKVKLSNHKSQQYSS